MKAGDRVIYTGKRIIWPKKLGGELVIEPGTAGTVRCIAEGSLRPCPAFDPGDGRFTNPKGEPIVGVFVSEDDLVPA